MASCKSIALVAVILCLSHTRVQGDDLQPLVKTTEDTLAAAKSHVEHMLNLSPLPNAEKIPPIVTNESAHLAYEIKKLATQLHEAVATGEHKPEVKEAVNGAVTHLNDAAASLAGAGSDVKQDNSHYYAAAETLLAQIKSVVAVGPCDIVAPLLKGALRELIHDVNNYQYGIHEAVGHHATTGEAGHHGAADHRHHHRVHQHHGASSEEGTDKGSEERHSHSHSHSHDHHHH